MTVSAAASSGLYLPPPPPSGLNQFPTNVPPVPGQLPPGDTSSRAKTILKDVAIFGGIGAAAGAALTFLPVPFLGPLAAPVGALIGGAVGALIGLVKGIVTTRDQATTSGGPSVLVATPTAPTAGVRAPAPLTSS